MKVNLYIYKFQNESFEIKDYFSKYRLNKINNSNNKDFINKTIQTEIALYEVLVNKYDVEKFEFKEIGVGRPILIDEDIHFNIAHSKDYLVIAVASKNISVDIEHINLKLLKIQSKIYLDNYPNNLEIVTKDFTIKESFIKFYSDSITKNLTLINIDDNFVYTNDENKLYYQSFKHLDYYITVASLNNFEVIINNLLINS